MKLRGFSIFRALCNEWELVSREDGISDCIYLSDYINRVYGLELVMDKHGYWQATFKDDKSEMIFRLKFSDLI